MATLAAAAHVLNPISHLSLSTVLLQVCLGQPLFLFPSGAHVSTVLGNESGFILNTCPIHLHIRVFICVHILSDLVLSLTSSFVTFIGQWIFRIFCKHLCWKLSSLSSSLFVMCQVSLPIKRTVRTFELNCVNLAGGLICQPKSQGFFLSNFQTSKFGDFRG